MRCTAAAAANRTVDDFQRRARMDANALVIVCDENQSDLCFDCIGCICALDGMST